MRVYIRINDQDFFESEELFKKLSGDLLYHILTKWKYKIMWHLRHLEEEIKSENGWLIVNQTGKIELKQFTEELTVKIMSSLDSMKDD